MVGLADQGRGSVGAPALHNPSSLVRFAWAAQLDAHQGRHQPHPVTGRQALAVALGYTPQQLSTQAAAGGDRLADLVDDLEQLGFARHGEVSRLAEQLQLRGERRSSVSPRWWASIRERFHLGDPDREPTFRRPLDVILAGEAFVAHHQRQLFSRSSGRRPLDGDDEIACRQLVASLGRLACGPYGVAHDALQLVAMLVPLEPELVVELLKPGGPRAQLVRAWERSVRSTSWNAHVRQQFASMLATPPEHVFRREEWLRGLRRLRLSDFEHSTTATTERRWLHQQLLLAMQGERGYAGARALDRRYALWVAAEVTPDDGAWAQVVAAAGDDPVLAQLVPTAETMRARLAAAPLHHRDGFWYGAADTWPQWSTDRTVAEILDATRFGTRGWSQHDTWRWARRATRVVGGQLVRDALLAPCAIRHRSAADALYAGGRECRASATAMTSAVLRAELAATAPHPAVVQRCLALLGLLRHPAAIPVVEDVLRATTTTADGTLAATIATAGDLAAANPGQEYGLVGWIAPRVMRHSSDTDLVVTGIHATVAAHRDPAVVFGGLDTSAPAVGSALGWAEEVLTDPLLPRR